VAKVGTSKAGGTISQQAAVHPWLAADAHGNKQTNKKEHALRQRRTHYNGNSTVRQAEVGLYIINNASHIEQYVYERIFLLTDESY
jgi:hypothetical protein